MTADHSFCRACRHGLSKNDNVGDKNGYGLLRCPSCASVVADPFPTAADLSLFYQSYTGSEMYGTKPDRKIARAKKRIKRLMPYTKGKKFLDVGCNWGFAVKAALDLGLDASGIDIDPATLNSAGKAFGQNAFRNISIEDLAKTGHKADIIYTSEVIEHVPDPDGFVEAIGKVLSPEGILFLTTPDGGHFSLPRKFADWSAVKPPLHISYFTRKGMRELLRRHGFEIKKFMFAWKPGMKLIAQKIK